MTQPPNHIALTHLPSAVIHKGPSNDNLGSFYDDYAFVSSSCTGCILFTFVPVVGVYSLYKLRKSKYSMKQGLDIKK